jgi:tRNA(fMet)-specific endonuclease VapC
MKIEYILDTCTVSHFLRGKSNVIERLIGLPKDKTAITSITIAEVYYGLLSEKGKLREDFAEEVRMAIHSFRSLSIDPSTAYRFASLKAKFNATGCKKDNDLWIVAFCEEHDIILITTDKKISHLINHSSKIEIIDIQEED